MKLQLLKKKSLSPVSTNHMNCDIMKASSTVATREMKIEKDNSQNQIEISQDHLSDRFPHESCQLLSNESTHETPNSTSR